MDLSGILRKDGKINNRLLIATNPIYIELHDKYAPEIEKYGISGVINVILYNNGIFKCSTCDNELDKFRFNMSFTCKKCAIKTRVEKTKTYIIEKYGVDNISKLPHIIDQIQKSKLYNKKKEISHTILENKDDIIAYLKKTIIRKNGNGINPKALTRTSDKYEIIKKYIETIIDNRDDLSLNEKARLAVFNNGSDICIECNFKKIETPTVAHPNVCRTCSIKIANQKRKKTSIEKYGTDHHTKTIDYTMKTTNMPADLAEIYMNPELVYDIYVNKCNKNLTKLSNYFGVSDIGDYFLRHGLEINKGHIISNEEREMSNFVSNLGFKVVQNDRTILKPKELDIYIPEKNLAIEYCGAYWHSELYKDSKYHYEKWKKCKENNVKLLTFWDYEVIDRQKQIFSFIKANLGIFDVTIPARKTIFKELNYKPHYFFEDNHIQGQTKIDRSFGLFYNDKLLGCVSYANHHRDVTKYTLNRLAFKSGVRIIGGVGKLLKNSLKLIDRDVITWSDNRYSTGLIYEQNGFDFDENMKPDYCYYDSINKCIVSKQSQQKNKIGCPKDVTEREFCFNNGKYRLWDCGKKRFIYKKENII